jgi:hypothetical protein
MLAKKMCQQVKFIGVSWPTQKCEPQASPKERFPYLDTELLEYTLIHSQENYLEKPVIFFMESDCGASIW